MSTNIDYLTEDCHGPYGPNHPRVREIESFFSQIQPDLEVRRYLQVLLGSCLSGRNVKEQVYILEGSGSNGKSKLLELLNASLGQYYGTINMSFFTGKKTQSSQATPEVEAIANARILTSSETEEGDRFKVDVLKRLSGNDKITYRGLHRPIKETVAPFTILFAVNKLPRLPEDDQAVWRRVRVIKFRSRFVSNPDSNRSEEFQRDDQLSEKFVTWRQPFLWLLLQWHREFIEKGLPDIQQVLEETDRYRTSQDPAKSWLDNNLEITGNQDDYVQVKWIKKCLLECGIYQRYFKKDSDFTSYLTKTYPTCEYVKELTRIKQDRVRNVLRSVRVMTSELEDECLLDCTVT
jgi:P4 family phage/plasmid primase-like protien